MIAKTLIRSILKFTGIDKIKKERKIKKACTLLQNVGGEALQAYYDVASELSITFIPMFGTLLGIYRNNDFILMMMILIWHLISEACQIIF